MPELDMTRIDAREGDRADERIVHDLEGEHGEGFFVTRQAQHFFAGIDVDALDRLAIDGRRQIVDDGVEQRLHALVLEGGAAQNRNEGDVADRLADQPLQGLLVGLDAIEIGGHDVVIELNRRLQQDMPIFLGFLLEIGGNFGVVIFRAEGLVFPDHSLHADEIDDALEIGFGADRQLDADRTSADLRADLFDAAIEIGADLVHLVDENDARHMILVGLAPNGLGLRLDALVAVEHAYRAVEHAQRTLDLDGEIDVAGRVDDVQALAVPEGRRRGGGDRNATLLLLLHPVHGRSAIMHFADLMRFAGIIEDALGRRRLARINMGHDAEVPVVLDWMAARHNTIPSSAKRSKIPTSDNARRRGWLPPSDACLPASSPRCRDYWRRPSVRRTDDRPWSCRCVPRAAMMIQRMASA